MIESLFFLLSISSRHLNVFAIFGKSISLRIIKGGLLVG